MGKRGLGIGLFLLSLALSLGPLIYAFSIHDWNYGPLITPEPNLIEEVKGKKPIDIKTPEYDLAEGTVTVEVSSRIPFSLRVEELTIDLICDPIGSKLGSLSLQEPADIPSNSITSITLYADIDRPDLLLKYGLDNVVLGNLVVTVNGVEIALSSEAVSGMA